MRRTVPASGLLLLCGAAAAQVPPAAPRTACLPPELAAWSAPQPATAAARPTQLGSAELETGRAYGATLRPQADLQLSVAPARPAATGTSGGLFGFTVARAGRYRIALGAGAWLEVVQNGKVLPSAAHGHGPACGTVRKMVDFDLPPGRYILQLSGSPQPSLGVLVARLG